MVPISIYNLKPPSSPSQGFLRLVCKPIPKSVTEIKMYRLAGWRGWHRYVFHFKIDEADLSPILNSWPLQEIRHFKYNPETSILSWEPIDFFKNLQLPSSRELYNIRSGESGPEWFNLEQWDNPQAYKYTVRGEVRRLRLLVYNKKLGEAYFIDCRSTD
jgi:hypothetical protein